MEAGVSPWKRGIVIPQHHLRYEEHGEEMNHTWKVELRMVARRAMQSQFQPVHGQHVMPIAVRSLFPMLRDTGEPAATRLSMLEVIIVT